MTTDPEEARRILEEAAPDQWYAKGAPYFNPERVAALLDRLEAAERVVEAARAVDEGFPYSEPAARVCLHQVLAALPTEQVAS